ncbi:hypothetical protein ACH4E8_09370 [Streptomyces sp. NPDC017979]|uniref:hypothetical protein n=1 Tax=Streptomyces sp. NPDC017979 TaxID=3365024 RepID=UPI0037B03177
MTVDGLTGPLPELLTAACALCCRLTYAPVPYGCVDGTIHYACPECVPLLTPGPTPEEHPSVTYQPALF